MPCPHGQAVNLEHPTQQSPSQGVGIEGGAESKHRRPACKRKVARLLWRGFAANLFSGSYPWILVLSTIMVHHGTQVHPPHRRGAFFRALRRGYRQRLPGSSGSTFGLYFWAGIWGFRGWDSRSVGIEVKGKGLCSGGRLGQRPWSGLECPRSWLLWSLGHSSFPVLFPSTGTSL